MGFSTHVFISYSHADNLPAAGPGSGWVTQFHDRLEPFLTMRLKRTKPQIWRDKRLSDNDVFDPVIMKQLPDSAVLLAVVSDNYVGSEWCRREAQAFCDAAAAGVGLAPANKQRVFKIILLPPEQQDQLPAPMRQILGKNFYVRVDKDMCETMDEKDTPVFLSPDFGPSFAAKFNLQVNMLAQDIADTLRAIDSTAAATASATGANKPCVYLAQCDEDRRADRDALRSELVQHGHQVLPDRELPQNEAELREVVAGMLERAALSVHLLGSAPGKVPSGAGLDSELVIQNALAVERARVAPLRRLVSLPKGTVCLRPNHQQFLLAIANDAEVLGNAQLIDGDLGKVIEEMHDALKAIEAEIEKKAEKEAEQERAKQAAALHPLAAGAAGQKLKLYVIFTEGDLEATGDLRDALEERFDLRTPVFEGTPQESRQANQERLTECDAVLVYWGAGTDGWIASVLSEADKALAWREGRPFRAVLQCIAGPSTAIKRDKVRKPKPNVINALAADASSLPALIQNALGKADHV